MNGKRHALWYPICQWFGAHKAKQDSQSRYYAQIGQGKAMGTIHTLIERYMNLG
jgi:hypothetical protein